MSTVYIKIAETWQMEHIFSSMFGHKTGSTDAVANVGNCKKLKLKYLSFDMEGRCQEKKDTTLAKITKSVWEPKWCQVSNNNLELHIPETRL